MKKRNARIYIDTSVVSYHTARLHRNALVGSRQRSTRKWREYFLKQAEFCVSVYVLEEIAKGDPEAARERIALSGGLKVLGPDARVGPLSRKLMLKLGIPRRSEADALHLAVAALNHVDYIVSWNFKHMANDDIRDAYRRVCVEEGLRVPIILAPDEMMTRGGLI